MEKGICVIIAAGEHFSRPQLARPDDFVIAADGGLTYTEKWNICPDLIVGDFDSLPYAPPTAEKTVTLPTEKDDTDMVAALREGWERGFRNFHIYGGTGGRLDHTIANIQCLANLAKSGGRGLLIGQDTVITAICQGTVTFPPNAEGTISVFAHSDTVTGVYERGLKYSLTDQTLSNTYPQGVSNEFTGQSSSISVRTGTLIIIYPKSLWEGCPMIGDGGVP